MKVLFVCHRLPYPPNRGGKIRPFNMIRHLAQKHSVVVASLAHTEKELKDGGGLTEICDEIIADVLPSGTRWLQACRALMTKTPSSVAYFWSPRLYERIKQRILCREFDVVIVHCAFMAQYVKDHAGFRILDFGDLDSAKWSEYSRWKAWPISLGYALESKKLQKYERQMAERFNYCTVTARGEKEEFETLRVSTPCRVIPNGVDTSYFSAEEKLFDRGCKLVFLGRMDYFPNIDAVRYFVDKIFPLIRQKKPNLEFGIVGAKPSRKVRELADVRGVTVTGHVPDVRSYLAGAVVSVAPLRIARGTQNKILESMAMGVPVVATPQAAKGIQAIPGEHLLVAEQPEMFARHVIDILENVDLQRRLAVRARTQIENAHAWATSMKILDQLLPNRESSVIQQANC
jgi:polysaccharide biosynthesis protein PslH